jgi:hypothetical protein
MTEETKNPKEELEIKDKTIDDYRMGLFCDVYKVSVMAKAKEYSDRPHEFARIAVEKFDELFLGKKTPVRPQRSSGKTPQNVQLKKEQLLEMLKQNQEEDTTKAVEAEIVEENDE